MHNALTVIAKIDPDRADGLVELLDRIGQDIRGVRDNDVIRLSDITSLHFGRWVVIPNVSTGEPDYLLFTTNYDGTIRAHINEFIDKTGPAMDQIWGACEGYPQNRTTNPDKYRRDFFQFIHANSVPYHAFYIGIHKDRVSDVTKYKAAREGLQEFIDDPDVEGVISTRLRSLLDKLPGEEIDPPHPLASTLALLNIIRRVLFFVGDLIINLFNIAVLAPIRRLTKNPTLNDTREDRVLNLDLTNESIEPGVEEIEDQVTQNQITVISSIKPGYWNLLKLRIVLYFIGAFARHFENRGSLGGIATIHFARWCIIDNGRYLLFESNYDGSWESYIGDFSDKVAWGLDLIWVSHPDYPKGGAADIQPFKDIIRRNQVRTQVFYSAYPDLTIFNRINDREIARTLRRDRVEKLLRRL